MAARKSQHSDSAELQAVLAAHRQECELCTTEPLPLETLAQSLHAGAIEIDTAALQQHALLRLQPEMARLRSTTLAAIAPMNGGWWQQVAVALALALLPLPLVLGYDAYFLQLLYTVMQMILPANLATLFVISYGALLLLLFAGTYAAIPVLMARNASTQPAAHG